MKRRLLSLLLLVLTSSFCETAGASPASCAIRAAYARLDAAYNRRDVPGVLALYAPNFLQHDSHGAQNKAQTRRRLIDDFGGTKAVKAVTRIKSLIVNGGQAEATVARRVDVVLPKPVPNLLPPYFVVEVSQETWQKMPDGWRLTGMQETPLQRLLRGLDVRDQTIRREIIADPKNPALAARMKVVDAADRAQIKQIIQRYGWPGFNIVGTTGAITVWEIVQHSDGDRAFQKSCLPLLQAAVRRGQARPDDLALLTDRILRGEGKPQVYGSQFRTDARGVMVPQPTEDPTHVDQRRAAVGLAPLAEYAKMIQQMYHPVPKPAPSAPGK